MRCLISRLGVLPAASVLPHLIATASAPFHIEFFGEVLNGFCIPKYTHWSLRITVKPFANVFFYVRKKSRQIRASPNGWPQACLYKTLLHWSIWLSPTFSLFHHRCLLIIPIPLSLFAKTMTNGVFIQVQSSLLQGRDATLTTESQGAGYVRTGTFAEDAAHI